MKTDTYRDIIHNAPIVMAVFKISKVPDWAKPNLVKDEEVIGFQSGVRKLVPPYSNYRIGPSYLTFVEYRTIPQEIIYPTGY